MAGYVVIVSDITDEALFTEFLERVGATVEAQGGRYLVRGGVIEIADGDWAPDRLVVIEFDSVEQARAWVNSPGYTEIKGIRARSASASIIIAEGA